MRDSIMATTAKKNTRTATKRNAKPVTGLPANVLKSLKGNEKVAKQAVTEWRATGSKVDLERAPALVAAAVRIATAPHGFAMIEAAKVGITESNEASRFAGAWKASLAFSTRNGGRGYGRIPDVLRHGEERIANGDMLTIARVYVIP